jgi:hypothetical protein
MGNVLMLTESRIGHRNESPLALSVMFSPDTPSANGLAEKHAFERDVVNVVRRAGQLFASFFA